MSFFRPRIRLIRWIGYIGLAGMLVTLPFELAHLIKGEHVSGPMARMALLSNFGILVSFWLGYEWCHHWHRSLLELKAGRHSEPPPLAPTEVCYGLRGPRRLPTDD